MLFLGNTSHHDYAATSPACPAVLSATATNLRSVISNQALAIGLLQDRLRSLLPEYKSLEEEGAAAQELAAKEAELKTTSGELKACVERFEASLASWEEEVGGVEEEREKRKRSPSEEGEVEDDDDNDNSPPRIRRRFEDSPPPATIPRPIVRQRYQNVGHIDRNSINVGDIGWAPLPRMSLSDNAANAPSAYGQICIKVYPFIIVRTMGDCMIGVVITSAGGNGLRHKEDSLCSRSTYVVGARFRGYTDRPYGGAVGPAGMNLEVERGGYEPAMGAFVDVLDSYQLPYNTRFEKEGRLTQKSRLDLGRMRVAAMMGEAS
jgi:hypothetical protein